MLTNPSEKLTISPLGLEIHSELTFEEWSDLAPKMGMAHKSMSFVIGDWLVYGEDKFAPQPNLPGLEIETRRIRVSGDRYEAIHASTGLDPATLKSFAYVSRRVKRLLRNNLLSWEHHKVVAKLNEEKQAQWIATATAESSKRISVRRLRASIISGRVLSNEELTVSPAEQGVTNHIPSINRLCGWWEFIGGETWIKTRSPDQLSALLRDFDPIVAILNQLRTSIQ